MSIIPSINQATKHISLWAKYYRVPSRLECFQQGRTILTVMECDVLFTSQLQEYLDDLFKKFNSLLINESFKPKLILNILIIENISSKVVIIA